LMVLVVFPTPPFWLKIEMTFALPCSLRAAGAAKLFAFLPSRLAVVATSSAIVDLAFNLQTSFLIYAAAYVLHIKQASVK
jgi:hypothetical protein